MSDWLFITAVLAVVIIIVLFIILYYFTRYKKPVPKPVVYIQEILDPENEEEDEEVSKTIRFVLYNTVNSPAIVKYPVYIELFDTEDGTANTAVGPIHAITQNNRITKENPGVWDIENFIEAKRQETGEKINQLMVQIDLKDSGGRKYCYCGFFKYNEETREWKPVMGNEFYIRYRRLKCIFCLLKLKGIRPQPLPFNNMN